MEEEARSADSSEVVVKSRNASGCLIVRKAVNGMAMSGVGAGGLNLNGGNKERKRHRIAGYNSVESLEPYRRGEVFRTNQVFGEYGNNGQREYGGGRSGYEHMSRDDGEGYRKRHRSEFVQPVEYGGEREGDFKMHRSYNGGGAMHAEVSGRNYLIGHASAQQDEEEDGIRYRRRHSDFMTAVDGNDRRVKYYGDRNRYSNGSHLPGTSGNSNLTPREEYIRIQGKNGVLRVKVNKLKDASFLKANGHVAGDERMGSGIEDLTSRKEIVRPSSVVEDLQISQDVLQGRTDSTLKTHMLMPTNKSRTPDVSFADNGTSLKLGTEDQNYSGIAARDGKNNPKADLSLQLGSKDVKPKGVNVKGKQKLQSLPTKSDNGCGSQIDNGGTSLKLGSSSAVKHNFDEVRKSEENRATPLEKCPLTRSMDGKQQRGSGTEKQKLREQIRKMLLDSGWTIDYRPRRNRDYQDAVYVSPSGTAYWSIVKAYEGFQKDNRILEPVSGGSQFSPVADDVLSKLTRQTRKKMEKEMKKKCQNGEGSGNLQDIVSKKPAKAKHAASIESLHSLINDNHKSMDDTSNGNFNNGSQKTSKKQSRRTLLVRIQNTTLSSDDDVYAPYTGKRTLLSWLIDCGTMKLNEKVQYMNHKQTKTLQQGWITRDGIHCLCCSKNVTISKFELHAGGKVHQPLQSIFLESRMSLLQCMIDAWNKQTKDEKYNFHQVDTKGDDQNDDICGICGDGGDLICCDGCPSTFHQNCLGVEILPPGEWHCPNCLCSHCGLAADNAQGSDEICSPLLACNFCGKKYHLSCARVAGSSCSSSFCDLKCKDLYESLQRFVGVKHDLGSGFSWSIIHRTDMRSDSSLQDLASQVECNCKLAVSQEIMDECFLPIVDQRSGVNIIRHVVYNYGSNFNRLNYSKFYTAILERGDEMISAASLRFHGDVFAEMPFIGTRHVYRQQGMCRRLLSAIEMALRFFKVKKLVIPATSELMHTWTEVFRFNHIPESDKKKFRSMNILVFPGVDMLQKLLLDQNNLKTLAACTALKSSTHEGLSSMLIKSKEERSAGTGQDDGNAHSIQPTENQGDTSDSDSHCDSDSDTDHKHASNTSHPTSSFDFPPRISVIIGDKDKHISKPEGDVTNEHYNKDTKAAADASGNENGIIAAKTTSLVSDGSPFSELDA